MAKRGLPWTKVEPVLGEKAGKCGWSLCVGAGTSIPMFPSWRELVEALIKQDRSTAADPAGIADILTGQLGFGLDTLIQAAQDRLKMSADDFVACMVAELYSHLQQKLAADEFQAVLRALGAMQPNLAKLSDWKTLLACADTRFGFVSALALARLLADIIETDLRPRAVYSFNAEPLLYALVNGIYATTRVPAEAAARGQMSARRPFDMVTGALSFRSAARVPYFFCHGLLPTPGAAKIRSQQKIGLDKLVFRESEYLGVATDLHSWQSTAFLDGAMFSPMVFVGVSLTDPNMRRWLSSVQRNRVQEVRSVAGQDVDTSVHFWINKRWGDERIDRWTEAAVADLGVRIVWLDQWEEVGPAFGKLLGRS